jgi:N utilization substance protein B
VINEAVELAKAFGSENSSKFINGVLGTALRDLEASKAEQTPEKKKEKK